MLVKENDINSVYEQVQDWIEGDKINTSSIIILVTHLIPIVQKTVNEPKKGPYKKELVIQVINKLIRNSDLDQQAKSALYLLTTTTIPITINTMISLAHGDIDISKTYNNASQQCCIIQ